MKKIEILTAPARLADLRRTLTEAGIDAITVSEVKGFSRTATHKQTFRGKEFSVEYLPKLKIEIILENDAVTETVWRLAKTARASDEQKIFVYEIEDSLTVGWEELAERAH